MLLYVTKWAARRGILLVEGSRPEKRGRSLHLYSSLSGVGRRMGTVIVGSEAFLTLAEAKENVRERFKTRRDRAWSEFTNARKAWEAIEKGTPIAVHKKPTAVSKCGPFLEQGRKRKSAGRSGRTP